MRTIDFRVQMAKDCGKTVAGALAKAKPVQPVLEPKYDGWRCVVVRTEDGVDIYKPSRNSDPSKKYTGQLPELEADLMQLPVGAILDGELVALAFDPDTGGWANDFFRIHTCMRSNTTTAAQRAGIKLIAFDCISAGDPPEQGIVSHEDLFRRREHLARVTQGCALVEITLQMEATQENHDQLVEIGFEGTVVKDASRPYAFGKRGHGWIKIKNVSTVDGVIVEVVMDGKGQHLGKAGRMRVGQYKACAECGGDGHDIFAQAQGLGRSRPCPQCEGTGRGELVEVAVVNCLNNKQRDDATLHPENYVGRVLEVKVYGRTVDGFRHPTPLRFRDGDKLPEECLYGVDWPEAP